MSDHALEALIRRTARQFGVDIKRHKPGELDLGQLPKMLQYHGINLVLDVGANSGQFARSLRALGYRGRMVSIEPLSAAYKFLVESSRTDPGWEIAPRSAVGNCEGEIEIHISGNSVSSSVLEMLDSHSGAAPNSEYVGKEMVNISTLDALAGNYLEPGSVTFLKIDTQGYEDRVLDGATKILANAKGLQLELSLLPLYEGQLLFDALSSRLLAMGFVIWAITPGFSDHRTGRMLQVDATFFRD